MFNTMFKTHVGPVEDDENIAYLPPETAQGMFINFVNVATTMRRKLPFGIAQIRKSFRNEITPATSSSARSSSSRWRSSTSSEPGTDEQAFDEWVDARERWYIELGINAENLRRYEHAQEKLSHYSKRTVDIEYRFPFGEGWGSSKASPIALRARQQQLGPVAARAEQWPAPDPVRRGQEAARAPWRGRARGRPDACRADLPHRRLRRTGARRREERRAHRPAPAPGAGALQGVRPAAVSQQAGPGRSRARHLRGPAAPLADHVSTRAATWASCTAARTRSARRSASPSTSRRSTTGKVTIRDRDSMDQSRFGRVPLPSCAAGSKTARLLDKPKLTSSRETHDGC